MQVAAVVEHFAEADVFRRLETCTDFVSESSQGERIVRQVEEVRCNLRRCSVGSYIATVRTTEKKLINTKLHTSNNERPRLREHLPRIIIRFGPVFVLPIGNIPEEVFATLIRLYSHLGLLFGIEE